MPRFTPAIPEITVFISSPSDVAAEREIVKRVIQEINDDPAWRDRCVLKPLAYEDHRVPTQMGKSAQRVVDDFMRRSCEADIVVCIFCNRMGTPTIDERDGKEYHSGTHYEFDSAYRVYKNGGGVAPRILLYLGSRDFPDTSSDEDHDQYIAARKFKKDIKSCKEYEGLHFEYRDPNQLKDLVRIHLKLHLSQILAAMPAPVGARPTSPGPPPGLRAYLGQMAENYRWLELQGIREAGTLRIELEKVYVALKAEPESEYDRQQAANLHSVEVREAAGVDSIDVIDPAILEEYDAVNLRRTYRPGRDEAKRAAVTEVRTLGDAFRQHRRMVILGGPGSGKTTLGRWLALQLARALLRELDTQSPQRVMVPVAQIDPDARSSGGELVDLGPARLPIFLRLAHFARGLADRERQQQPSLALIDYLGHDPDSRSLADGLTSEARNALFRTYLQNRQAVVVLDGLDELPEANRRAVVLKIQDFVEKHTAADGTTEAGGPPWECGGNQVVVTSRYVGYKLAPVRAECVHFGIQSMQRPAVERFAHSWTDAVNAELGAEGRAGVVAERLIAEIYNDARPAVRELATNPLLVTILATVYWRDGQLPDQRAGVYDRVVENLLRIWLNREECRAHNLTREELLAALEPLAADMQENASSNGLIGLDRIGELVEWPLAHLRGMNPNDRRFRPLRVTLLGTIRKHVGLLAEQSSGNYAFFHRTFQEFLAARHLLADRKAAAGKIGDRIDDPLWREPLLLALGFAMIDREWGPEKRSRLLSEVLATDGPDTLIPRAALLLVTALPDLRDAPALVVGQTVVRLLTSYAISQDQEQAGVLREQIEQAFGRLRDGRQVDTVARQLAESLRRPASERDLAGATATIIRRIDWFTTELVESLLVAVHRDRADLDWPIHRALLAALGHRPTALPWLTPAPTLNVARLLSTYLPMRKLLEASPELVALVRGDADWLCLLIALYGGLGHLQLLEQMEKHQQQVVQTAPSSATPVPVVVEPEPDPLPPLVPAVELSPQDIVHDLADAELSRLIQRHLGARKSARELATNLKQRWEGIGNPAGCAEALVGLAALGEDVLPLLRAALAHSDRRSAAHAALARFGWLRALLREPLFRVTEVAVRTIPDGALEHQQLDLLRVALAARMASGGAPLPVSDKIPECRYVGATTAAGRAALEAEYWSHLFSGAAGDGRREGTPFASVADRVTRPLDHLIRAWSLLPEARNHLAARRFPWPQPILVPRADTPVDRYLTMLDAMTGVPREHHCAAGYVLGRCRPFLEEHPSLAWETSAVCLNHGKEFLKGYRYAVLGCTNHGRREKVSELEEVEAPLFACLMSDQPADDAPPLLSWWKLFLRMSRIADPYLRFRALWRFLGAVAGEDEAAEVDVIGLVEQIPDPHNQVRALEWILMTIPAADIGLVNHIGLLDPMVRTLSRIADPENRARAQCRLAFFASEHLETLLRDAVESVRGVADLGRKAETIGEIRAAWGRTAGVAEALDAVAGTIPDPWERDKALGRVSRLVQAFRHQCSAGALAWRLPPDAAPTARVFRQPNPTGSLPWGIVYLSATAAEVESLGATSVSGEAHWDRLLGAERALAIAALVTTGLESGVPVTTRRVSILDRMVQGGRAEDLDDLWPYLDRPDPGAMGTVARWSAHRDRAGQWSALVQAEGGRLNPEIVTSVIGLLADSKDRLRHRAALALHGPIVHPLKKALERRWSVRRVGAATVDALARSVIRTNYPRAVLASLGWVRCDIHHDDPEAIKRWLAQASVEGRSSPAAWILESLESVQSDLIFPLLTSLQTGPAELQRSLLIGLARVAHCSNVLKESAKAAQSAVAGVPQEVRARVWGVLNGPVTVLNIAKQAAELSREDNRVEEARRLLNQQIVWTTESDKLAAVGACFYPQSTYWSDTNRAAAALTESSDVLQLLLRWVEAESVNADFDLIVGHLLTATAAVARLSPVAFAAVADPDVWEPLLTELVQVDEYYVTRMAAVRLLGYLRRVTNRVAVALSAAMNDVSFVQQAAYESASEFRSIEGDILPELLLLLKDPSAGVVAATTSLLVGVARAEGTSADRRRILRGLQEAVAKSSVTRPIYLMDWTEGRVTSQFVDRLDRILYRAIFEVSGL